ncbi:MAG TPA: EAL domain-containing protein [Acidimicrobiales bacterium]|nr:EAL domain-containing protein [Acidimicrobiales bacterium]
MAEPLRAETGEDRAERPSSWRGHVWVQIGSVLLVLGVGASVFGASSVAQQASDQSYRSLVANSADIASTLKLAIVHEQDLVTNVGALFVRDPQMTQTEFLQWIHAMSAFSRYPELQGLSELVMVRSADLVAFASRILRDPPGTLSANGAYVVTPAGFRPYYCLETVSVSRVSNTPLPAALDYCATGLGSDFLKARDTGLSMYIPYSSGKAQGLGLGTAIYESGTVPSTVQARQAKLIGWTGIEIFPAVLLSTALAGHPDTAVSFRYGSSKVNFTAGHRPVHAVSRTIGLHNGWTVQTFGSFQSASLLKNGNALALLLVGIATSLLLSLLIYVLGTSRARTREKLHQRTGELRYQALHDPLTHLPNRALILDRTEQLLARSRRSGLPVAALFIDLDDFKDINDGLGHSAGDELLVAVAARLSAALREGDSVGRLGGDEFILLVEGPVLAAGAEVVADRILEVLAAPLRISGSDVPLSVSASIGVAVGPRATPDELLRDADIALYRAKAAGKGRAVVFAPSMQVAVQDRRTLSLDLQNALANGELFLLYQPTFNLANGSFTGVEALLRWRHPNRGVVLPDEFIPAMELSGLIVPVGAWVLEEACRQGAEWQAEGHQFTVSVNVSARQLEHNQIVDDVRLALAASGFDPGHLVLELTETTLMSDVDETLAHMAQLKTIGIRLAVDDFGTGYSSLSYLRRFPIDVLKIDRSFISGVTDSVESAALVHALVQLGKVLNLETVAEGIEDDEQRQTLQAESVDTGQGFLFSRPIDAASVDRLLADMAEASGVPIQTGSRA